MISQLMKMTVMLLTTAMLMMTAMLAGCSDEDASSTDAYSGEQPFTLVVSEVPWDGQTVSLTRSGETLASLQQTSNPVGANEGFGLFCTSLSLNNQQVTWDATTLRWNLGNMLIWPKPKPTDFYAYAPYHIGTTLNEGKMAFTCPINNTTDLLWAEASRNQNEVDLQFHHALAKLSFGTITNGHLDNITLNSIVVKDRDAQRLYQSGNLLLVTGGWTDLTPWSTEQTISYTDFDPNTGGDQTLTVNSGTTGNINVKDILQIPGPTVEITVTYNTTKTITFTTTLEKGKNKTLNLTIGKNHEVVIEE